MKTRQKIFFAKLLAKVIFFFLRNSVFIVNRCNINWKLDINEGIDLSIFVFGKFEDSIIKISKHLISNKQIDIIDIGSNNGVHCLRLAENYKLSKIYAIEPTNYSYNKMIENLSLNKNINNIFPFQYFLTDEEFKPDSIYSSWNLKSKEEKHALHMGIKKSISNSKTISFDNFIIENKIQKKTLIKCDVDGNEMRVFNSGKNYFKKYKPYIIMELAPYLYKENGYTSDELLQFLINLNYEFYDGNSFKKISNIFDYASKIENGSSVNIFLK